MTNPSESPEDGAAWWDDEHALTSALASYEAIRKRIQDLHVEIQAFCGRHEFVTVARTLGMWQGDNLFVSDGEVESAIFSDYLLNFSRLNATTPCERYLKSRNGRQEDDLTRRAHAALASLRYTVLRMEEPRPGFGVLCHDCFLDVPVFLMDRAFSQTATSDVALATGLYGVDNWIMTTGAALPLPAENIEDTLEEIFRMIGKPFKRPLRLKDHDASRLAVTIIPLAKKAKLDEHIGYE